VSSGHETQEDDQEDQQEDQQEGRQEDRQKPVSRVKEEVTSPPPGKITDNKYVLVDFENVQPTHSCGYAEPCRGSALQRAIEAWPRFEKRC
jgi:hypothetical protein